MANTARISPTGYIQGKNAATHPPTGQMVDAAIKTLDGRYGSSLFAIKKYIGAEYNVDIKKLDVFIKRYLKNAVTMGKLVQVKGTGASGSFKFSTTLSNNKPNTSNKEKVKKSASRENQVKAASPAKKSVDKAIKNVETKTDKPKLIKARGDAQKTKESTIKTGRAQTKSNKLITTVKSKKPTNVKPKTTKDKAAIQKPNSKTGFIWARNQQEADAAAMKLGLKAQKIKASTVKTGTAGTKPKKPITTVKSKKPTTAKPKTTKAKPKSGFIWARNSQEADAIAMELGFKITH